jgi:hypothetical protein
VMSDIFFVLEGVSPCFGKRRWFIIKHRNDST